MAAQIVMDRTGDNRHFFEQDDPKGLAEAERRFKKLTPTKDLRLPLGRRPAISRLYGSLIRLRMRRCSTPAWSAARLFAGAAKCFCSDEGVDSTRLRALRSLYLTFIEQNGPEARARRLLLDGYLPSSARNSMPKTISKSPVLTRADDIEFTMEP
ncbi:hypothetical protein ACVWZR_000527 [Bradyrhizobium sp. i1.3.1]